MQRLIILEGIAGTGKTTYMRRLKKDLSAHGYPVEIFEEGTHPYLDLAYSARLTTDQKTRLKTAFPELKSAIDAAAVFIDDMIILPYTKINPTKSVHSFYEMCESFNLHHQDDFKDYKETYTALWRHYQATKPEKIHIVTGVFMQNHYDFLYLKNKRDENEIYGFLSVFLKTLDPIVYNIEYADVNKGINKVIKQRNRSKSMTNWLQAVKRELARLPLARKRGYDQDMHVVQYFSDQQNKSREVLKSLPGDIKTMELDADYDQVYAKILAHLLKELKKPRKTLEM